MAINTRKIFKAISAALLSVFSTLILIFGTLFCHLKIYHYLFPNEVTEIDHNIYLESQVEIHFLIAIPVFYLLSFWFIWSMFNRRVEST